MHTLPGLCEAVDRCTLQGRDHRLQTVEVVHVEEFLNEGGMEGREGREKGGRERNRKRGDEGTEKVIV